MVGQQLGKELDWPRAGSVAGAVLLEALPQPGLLGVGPLLEATEVAIVDEIAGAANLVLAKAAHTPFALVRGLDDAFFGEGSVRDDIVRAAPDDLFR